MGWVEGMTMVVVMVPVLNFARIYNAEQMNSKEHD